VKTSMGTLWESALYNFVRQCQPAISVNPIKHSGTDQLNVDLVLRLCTNLQRSFVVLEIGKSLYDVYRCKCIVAPRLLHDNAEKRKRRRSIARDG